jgi:hypothetical protein
MELTLLEKSTNYVMDRTYKGSHGTPQHFLSVVVQRGIGGCFTEAS